VIRIKVSRWLFLAVIPILLFTVPNNVKALDFELGKGITLDVDTTITYGAAWRTEGQDKDGLKDILTDDGNRNFDQGDMINNRWSIIADIDLHKGDYGFFMRPKAFFDFAYDGSNANDSPGTNNSSYQNGGDTDYDEFHEDTQSAHRDKAEILDFFAYGNHSFGNTDVMFRVGRQAVNWGESLFVMGGISGATAYLDTTNANVPGVEIRELLMPSEQVYFEISKSDFTLAAFYQWKWDKHRLDESGSYFSVADELDSAGERILVSVAPGINATIDRVGDDSAKDSGQWGVALRYVAKALNYTEFGLYFVNYHEKMPIMIGNLGYGGWDSPTKAALGGSWANLPVAPGVSLGDIDSVTAATLNAVDMSSYYLKYAENVKLIGASVSGVIGETNVAGEVSYRYDIPICFKAPNSLLGFIPEKSQYIQGQISTITILPAGLFYEGLSIFTEIGVLHICDNTDLVKGYDRTSCGGVFKFVFDYFQIMQDLDLKVPVTFEINPSGTSPTAGLFDMYSNTGSFDEDCDSVALGLDFTYKAVYKLSMAYKAYLHGGEKNKKADRDFLSLNLKYTF